MLIKNQNMFNNIEKNKRRRVYVQVIYLSQTINKLKYIVVINTYYAMAATGWQQRDR